MTPAHWLGALAIVLIPALYLLVRGREADRDGEEVNDQRVSQWRAN